MADPATDRYAATAAPAALRRVQSFLNTRAVGAPDLLARPAAANAWLRTLDWPATPRLREDDLVRLRELRAALQAQLEGRGDADLAGVLGDLRWRMTLDDGRLTLAGDGAAGWQRVAGTLVADVLLAQQHDLWPRLKPCGNPRCSVIFYDNSKNRSRVWHNTATCGNVVNLRRARERRSAETA